MHELAIDCRSHQCSFVCNGSTIHVYMNPLTGLLEQPGYLECTVFESGIGMSAEGVPPANVMKKENVSTNMYSIRVVLNSTDNMTVTINSIMYNEQDNSNPPLYFHIVAMASPTGKL